jgi:hypothetical protein
MAKFKYTKEDVLKEMAEALNEVPIQDKAARPNLLQTLKAKAGLKKE